MQQKKGGLSEWKDQLFLWGYDNGNNKFYIWKKLKNMQQNKGGELSEWNDQLLCPDRNHPPPPCHGHHHCQQKCNIFYAELSWYPYLIFVSFFTPKKFWIEKLYTPKHWKHPKIPKKGEFFVFNLEKFSPDKAITRTPSVASVTNMRYEDTLTEYPLLH